MKIGKIVSVEYDKFRVRLFSTTKNSTVSINGQVYYFGNIGSYLKTINSTGEYILCEVSAILDYNQEGKLYSSFNLDSSREFIVKPIGTIPSDGSFSMGVGIFPSLYNDVEIVTFDDLKKILSNQGTPDTNIHHTIDIGYSKSLINYKISLSINKLFNIHTAVLGNSGSGKSNTIARILQEVFRKEKNHAYGAKVILFDSNGEYPRAFCENLNNEIHTVFYKPNVDEAEESICKFTLPYYLMNLDEWLAFLMASERTQKPFWDNVLQECYKFYRMFNSKEEDDITQFANYIKWKTWRILSEINNKADSDSTRMTIAKGAIQKLKEICETVPKDYVSKDVVKDLNNFFETCINLCLIYYGNNNNSLSDALPKFVKTGNDARYVTIQLIGGNNAHYESSLSSRNSDSAFVQIDETSALKTADEKLESGEYFDYKFLKTAAELILLEEEAKGNQRIREFTSTLMTRLDVFLYNSECEFMREKESNYKDEEDYLTQVFGISNGNNDNQLVTIDSSEVGTDTLELMTSVVSRMLFDYRKKQKGDNRRKNPIHLVLDEAHRYIRKDTEYILRENIFEKIAREGRKYSLYLLISSQRPSELSQTVLSQCGNYIVHRIQNEVDMNYIYSVLPYFSSDYINKIKQAVPGEALVFGNCVPMPLMIKVEQASPDPNSKNCLIDEEWFNLKK
jgi:hypothetical protein